MQINDIILWLHASFQKNFHHYFMEKEMKSKVYFIKVENGEGVASLAQKTGQLFDFAGFKDAIR